MEPFAALFLKESKPKRNGRLARFYEPLFARISRRKIFKPLNGGWLCSRRYADTPIRRHAAFAAPWTVAFNRLEAYATLAALAFLFWPFCASAQTPANGPARPGLGAAPASTSGAQLNVVDHLGDTDSALRDRKLLTYHRVNDPFTVPVRGKFRGLPPAIAPAKPATSAAVAQSGLPLPTLAMAVQALPIGAVDPNRREMLVGRHLVREGDLLVIELSGQRFVVWVQSIDLRGVQICDLGLKEHVIKAFRAGPMELMGDTVVQPNNVQSFLEHHEG
jgi:hypothetical protein